MNADTLISALLNPAVFPHEVESLELIETHISWIILTGKFAYKIKKPINLGFLDFSSLDKRRWFCEQELRINSRLASRVYLDVVPITGTASAPTVSGEGPAIEYAVRMRQFPQSQQLDHMLAEGHLTVAHVENLARRVAEFHTTLAAVADEGSSFGSPSRVCEPMEENFSQIEPLLTEKKDRQDLAGIRAWFEKEAKSREENLISRKKSGFIRECHGDLHLGNIAMIDDEAVLFDAIEFNDQLRWIDVMSDVAFLIMDLNKRQRPDLAAVFLNRYLEETGDYTGLVVLRYYLVYRALVRAKVDCIRAHQEEADPIHQQETMQDYRAYIELATTLMQIPQTALLIMYGLSGSGKTTVAGELAKCIPAVRIRSDIERKRLHGLAANAETDSKPGVGLYEASATERTYTYLLQQCQAVISAGFAIIVDASFLDRAQRKRFADLAHMLKVPFVILSCFVNTPDLLANRISGRRKTGSDASEANLAVLQRQTQLQHPLTEEEIRNSVTIDTGEQLQYRNLCRSIHQFLDT